MKTSEKCKGVEVALPKLAMEMLVLFFLKIDGGVALLRLFLHLLIIQLARWSFGHIVQTAFGESFWSEIVHLVS